MIKVEHIDCWGFEHAIRGMRNPMNSWEKSDSEYKVIHVDQFSLEETKEFVIGKNDLDLMRRLYSAGPEHRKYLRQIFVSMDITAPLYWWKEFDTYKVGTVANSCSTMHKLTEKEFTVDDFSNEQLLRYSIPVMHTYDFIVDGNKVSQDGIKKQYTVCSWEVLTAIINVLNLYRALYLETKDKLYWWQLIQLLPSSYNQRRTITMNYENVVSIIHQRTGHKLDEWNEFVKVLRKLPYVEEIMG